MPIRTRKLTDGLIDKGELAGFGASREHQNKMRDLLKEELSRIYEMDARGFFDGRHVSLYGLVSEVKSTSTAHRVSEGGDSPGSRFTLDMAFAGFAARNIEVAECRWSHSEIVVDRAMRRAMTAFANDVLGEDVPEMTCLDREIVRFLLSEYGLLASITTNENVETSVPVVLEELRDNGIHCELTGVQLRRIAEMWIEPWIVFLTMAFDHKLKWCYRV